MKEYPRTNAREAKVRRVLGHRQKDLSLVLCNIHDPHNVSAIFRSCDAFGVPDVHLYYTDTAFPTLGAKSSASARKWVTATRHSDLTLMVNTLHNQGFALLATSCTPAARSLYDYDLTKPTAFIMGNEHRGVEDAFLPLVDGEVFIPMYGMIQSFNVSVAAALLLAEAARQRWEKGLYDQPSYPQDELDRLTETWLKK